MVQNYKISLGDHAPMEGDLGGVGVQVSKRGVHVSGALYQLGSAYLESLNNR